MNNPLTIGFLFDLDGVLIDSERRYTRIWEEIERDYPTGIPDFPRVIKGTTLHNILDRYYPDPAVRNAVESRCLEAEKEMEYAYMPGAEKLLKELRDKQIPMCLVTSSDATKMESLRRKFPQIFFWFNAIVDGDMVTHGKPDPEPYLLGAHMIDLPAQQCIVVEDAITGMKAGHAAGAYIVGMTDTLGREAVTPYADIVLDSLEQLNVAELIESRRKALTKA